MAAFEELRDLENRIEAGERMRADHHEAQVLAGGVIERAVLLTGSEEKARKLAPDAFEQFELRGKRIAEIDGILEGLRQKRDAI